MTRPSLCLLLAFAACGGGEPVAPPEPAAPAGPTAADAKAFVERANAELRTASVAASQAAWTFQTDITDEHEKALAAQSDALMALTTKLIDESVQFKDIKDLDPDTARQLHLLRIGATIPAPADDAKRKELASLVTELDGMYGKGKYCPPGAAPDACQNLDQLEQILADSPKDKDAAKAFEAQKEAYYGWRTMAPPMKDKYTRFVQLGNEGADHIGFANMSDLWRSGYDMSPAAFDAEIERLWTDVKPLYEQLHCYARKQLSAHYGADKVPATGPMPAHIVGNMWSQSWENVYPLLTPYPDEPSLDVTAALQAKGWDHTKMVKAAEGFFTSLGLDPLPQTFWERSMFLRPEGKEVVCHASAWDVEMNNDLRIKMCIKIDQDNLVTLHHELGHNYYYHAYYNLPPLYQNGANDGFHEGIGDTLALSITPAYLKQVGILDTVSETEHGLLNKQMQDALQKIAFLPFGRMIDKWRWGVFEGTITPDRYNAAWWDLVKQYQGFVPDGTRGEEFFDAGAKYHIPANTPYMRYFLAHVLQFQFHEALCKASGHTGPLHTCSIAGSKEAGQKLQAMLALGASKPWPDALEAVAGTREMSARPMVEYFAPLTAWLTEQNKDQQCGW